jgi:hypothetical protein
MYERDVPNVASNVANPVPTETGANGAYCKAGSLRYTAPEYAVVSYVNRAGKSRNQLFEMEVIYKSASIV